MEPGIYSQIRLQLEGNNEIYVKELPYRLKVPSGEQTGVKLICPFEIKKGKMVEVVLDFDVNKSVGLTKGQGFVLKPVIKVEKIAEYDAAGIVSPAGGNVSTLDGYANVQIPTTALNESIIVSIDETDISSLPEPSLPKLTAVGKAFNFEPSGYAFNSSVVLSFKYDDAELNSKGLEQNLKLFRYDENVSNWIEIPVVVSPYSNTVYASVDHFSVYALYVAGTCSDGIQNGNESGIDCSGDCLAACTDCNGYNFGNASSSWVYSFNDSAVAAAAQEALAEYALYGGVDVSTLNTPNKKMEAVGYYVAAYMNWMRDEGDWNGTQTASRTVLYSGGRFGCFDEEGSNCNYCSSQPTMFYNKSAKYCGDCEDHAILRASLLRHLGVAQECVMNTDFHDGLSHPSDGFTTAPWELPVKQQIVNPEGPSGAPQPYDYETAGNLLQPESKKKGGHTFNVVIYNNKYRLMDYFWLGYYFSSSTEWYAHQVDNIWNDHFGQHWSAPFTSPPSKIHNYPGANKCYDAGKTYWTHRTLYEDICP